MSDRPTNHALNIVTWMINNPGHSIDSAIGIYMANTGINRCWIPTRVIRAFEPGLKAGDTDLLKPLKIATSDELSCKTYPDPISTAQAIVNQRQIKKENRFSKRTQQRQKTNDRIEDAMYKASKIS